MSKLQALSLGVAAAAILGVTQTASVYAQGAPATVSSGDGGGLEEIVVTANRRAENIQRSAVSIEAVSAEEISRIGVYRAEDINKIATGVVSSTASNYPMYYIRGVGNHSLSNYSEAAVATNIDGVYVSRGWALRGAYFDLDRIEVLKGPQGTLYGRNASGGTINVITAKPRFDEMGGYIEGEVGNYDLIDGTATLNVPITDKLAVRASGRAISRRGYTQDGTDDEKGYAGRLHVLYKPNSDLSVLVTGLYQNSDGKGQAFSMHPWTGNSDPTLFQATLANTAPPGFLLKLPGDPVYSQGDVYGVTAEIVWNFGPATLTIIPAYRSGQYSMANYASNYYVGQDGTYDQTTVEVRLSNESDRLKWVLGAFYFDENQGNQPGHDLRIADAVLSAERLRTFHSNDSSYAAFGQATYSLTEKFRVTGGLRYTHERLEQAGGDTTYTLPDFITGLCAPLYSSATDSPSSLATCARPIPLSGGVSANALTWKVGLEYDAAPNSLLYVNASTGFKAGGLYAAPPPNSFRPEKLLAFELGSKNRFLNNRLQFNAEAFYYIYHDHQEAYLGPTALPGYFTFVTSNAGRATSYGAAVNIEYEPTASDHFSLGVQYNKSRYDSYDYPWPTLYFGPPVTGCTASGVVTPTNPSQTLSCAGFQLVLAPAWTGNAGYDHTFLLADGARLNAGVSVEFSSSFYTAVDFLPGEIQQEFALLNADLAYTAASGRWSVSLWGRNLTEEAVFTQQVRSAFVNNSIVGPDGLLSGVYRPPRTFGVRARLNF